MGRIGLAHGVAGLAVLVQDVEIAEDGQDVRPVTGGSVDHVGCDRTSIGKLDRAALEAHRLVDRFDPAGFQGVDEAACTNIAGGPPWGQVNSTSKFTCNQYFSTKYAGKMV